MIFLKQQYLGMHHHAQYLHQSNDSNNPWFVYQRMHVYVIYTGVIIPEYSDTNFYVKLHFKTPL